MDEATLEAIAETARKNGIDPDELFAAVNAGTMPDELRAIMEDVLGEINAFGESLKKDS